jgi:hypothetical protein
VHHAGARRDAAAQRKPMLPADKSGSLPERASLDLLRGLAIVGLRGAVLKGRVACSHDRILSTTVRAVITRCG